MNYKDAEQKLSFTAIDFHHMTALIAIGQISEFLGREVILSYLYPDCIEKLSELLKQWKSDSSYEIEIGNGNTQFAFGIDKCIDELQDFINKYMKG